MSKLYFSITTFLLLILCSPLYAQPRTGEFIDVSAGFGLAAPYDESEITGSGFYAQAEYVWSPKTWFGVRPYAGVIIASDKTDENGIRESIKSNAFLLGGKIRLAAPIPYVAPFFEVGAGMSIGSFQTNTQYTSLNKDGVLFHIPVTLGLALGRKSGTEIKFTYYYHDAVEQFSGAVAVGFSIPINED
ncbi:hypothetical protein AMR72_09055 [Flavobacterium psychrophilum]|nr:hypothetical protein AMR72_09055 [Flavobacterium psychrophilum]AOE52641.1 hypothetical protein ALW18_09045 [Flavobacterium psychrophilum]